MKENKLKTVWVGIAFLTAMHTSLAQNAIDVHLRDVDVKTEPSEKINDNPSFHDTVKVNTELKYGMVERKATSNFKVRPISPPKIGTGAMDVDKLYNGFVKAGIIDFRNIPFIDAHYGSKYNRDYVYSVGLNHFGSDLKTASPDRARFTQSGLDFSGKRFLKNHVLSADLAYDYNTYRYYGSEIPMDALNTDARKQLFAKGHLQLAACSKESNTSIPYHKIMVDYFNIFDRYGMMENRLAFGGKVNPEIDLLKPYHLKLNLAGTIDWFNYKNDASNFSKNSILGTVLTSFHYNVGKIKANAGFNWYFLQDDTSGFRVYPIADIEYTLIKDVFVAYGKYQRYFQRYDQWAHAELNPFFNTSMQLTNTRHLNNFTAGFRGNISSKINFNLGIEFDQMKNLPMYVNDLTSFGNRLFTVVTDDVSMFRSYGQFSAELKKFQFAVKADYRQYTAYNELKAWQMPTFNAGFSGKYNFQNLIHLTAEVYYLGGIYAKEYDQSNQAIAVELPGIVDANFGIEYKYSKRWNAFINVNNFLNKQYRRWNNYPNYGLNFLGGLSCSF